MFAFFGGLAPGGEMWYHGVTYKKERRYGAVIQVVFFDVDGTLFSHTKKGISSSTRACLQALRERRIRCVVSTGRSMGELDALLAGETFDGYITLNGQLCLDARRQVVYANPFDQATRGRLARLFQSGEIPVRLVEEQRVYMNRIDERVVETQRAISTELPPVGAYTGAAIYQAILYVDQHQQADYQARLPGCTVTRWNPMAVDILPGNGSKANGILHYLETVGLGPEEAMAFGDGENDMEMLRLVHLGVAMGNASDQVKACADYVTAHIDQDGIAQALRAFQLID
jgi:hypothetical protein